MIRLNRAFKNQANNYVEITDFIDLVNHSRELNRAFPTETLFIDQILDSQEDCVEFHRFVLRELFYISSNNERNNFQPATEMELNSLFFAGTYETSKFLV